MQQFQRTVDGLQLPSEEPAQDFHQAGLDTGAVRIDDCHPFRSESQRQAALIAGRLLAGDQSLLDQTVPRGVYFLFDEDFACRFNNHRAPPIRFRAEDLFQPQQGRADDRGMLKADELRCRSDSAHRFFQGFSHQRVAVIQASDKNHLYGVIFQP